MALNGSEATFTPVIVTYGVFSQTNGCGFQLQTLTSRSCNIFVSFEPTEVEGYTGPLQVSGTGTTTRLPRAAMLSGVGVAPPTKCKKKTKTAAATKKKKCRKKKR